MKTDVAGVNTAVGALFVAGVKTDVAGVNAAVGDEHRRRWCWNSVAGVNTLSAGKADVAG